MAEKQLLGRPVWYELLTTDMKGAEDFYTKVVGWTVSAMDHSPTPYHLWHRAGNQGIGGVMTIPNGMSFPPHWEMYVGTPSLDMTIAKVERLGGKGLSDIIDVPDVGRLRVMLDPQGAVFALIEPSMAGEFEDQQPELGDASWRELYADDAPAAMKFYADVFGWKQRSTFDMGPMGTYYIWGRDWDMGGMMNKPKELAGAPSAWNIYFRVDDVDTGAERIKANGGQVINGPMDVPGGDRVVNAIDPQGAHFSLHSRK